MGHRPYHQEENHIDTLIAESRKGDELIDWEKAKHNLEKKYDNMLRFVS